MLCFGINWFIWLDFTIAFATHFFLILSEKAEKQISIKLYIVLYTLPIILLLKALFSAETPVAKGLVQSKIGLGWTYDLNIGSIWFWLYVLYIIIYFCISLYSTYLWAKKYNRLRFLNRQEVLYFLML